jgi:mRNA-degrading endonuclease RelE of RelBE toxin-antitoxin system
MRVAASSVVHTQISRSTRRSVPRSDACVREAKRAPADSEAEYDPLVKRSPRKKPPFVIEYSPPFLEHLAALNAGQRAIVLEEADVQLLHQPNLVTRNRKPLQPNPVARFELHIGELRVYYEVYEARRVVEVRAVGIKKRDRVFIGGEEIKLS